MKNLYLVRHAKSSWENKNLPDFERTLNDRGKRDAPFMAKLLKDKKLLIDLIHSSPAVRAFTTAKIFANEFNIPEENIVKNESIYEAVRRDLLKIITETDNSINNLMLFGHNPGITYLSNYLCDFETDNIPTCGIICMQLDFDSWKYLGNKSCNFKFFEYPKKFL
ncbi:MAG TPA: histidine phosphatase family protein [Ignavibacteriaceae bacterium]|nr:histidine phosphatase family protein [Ignavibacteriaceae bacterium]